MNARVQYVEFFFSFFFFFSSRRRHTRFDCDWSSDVCSSDLRRESARPLLEMLGVAPDVPVITRDQVEHAKPDPDLFLAAAAQLDVPADEAVVVGDSVWDLLAARRARALGVGLLSGGYGQDELELAGAYRVYQDPADLLRHLDEVGVRLSS